jgi:hypothetical protein
VRSSTTAVPVSALLENNIQMHTYYAFTPFCIIFSSDCSLLPMLLLSPVLWSSWDSQRDHLEGVSCHMLTQKPMQRPTQGRELLQLFRRHRPVFARAMPRPSASSILQCWSIIAEAAISAAKPMRWTPCCWLAMERNAILLPGIPCQRKLGTYATCWRPVTTFCRCACRKPTASKPGV